MTQVFDRVSMEKRSLLYQRIRQYFADENVLEVEVPVLGKGGSTCAYLESMSVLQGEDTYYLQTSPEFFMKRLLSEGSGDIFSIAKAFRGGEAGPRHNPEFSLLEWYRINFSVDELVADLASLLGSLGVESSIKRVAYAEVFERATGVDPHKPDMDKLEILANQAGLIGELDASEMLGFLMSALVEPKLPPGLVVVDEFPACQAELAQIGRNSNGDPVAKRFELYWDGVELANGYKELTDPLEQRRRFQMDLDQRLNKGLPRIAEDKRFIAALERGLPDCSGVALGLDRLLMCISGQSELSQSLCFSWDRL